MLTDSAYIAGLGQDVGLDLDEVVDGLLTAKEKKETEKGARYREAMLRRQANAGAENIDVDKLLEDAGAFESKGRFEAAERYPDPFGIPVSPADPENQSVDEFAEDRQRIKPRRVDADKVVRDMGRRKREAAVKPQEQGRKILRPRQGGNEVILNAKTGEELASLIKQGLVEEVWREKGLVREGDEYYFDRDVEWSDQKYVRGRKDPLASGERAAPVAPVGIGMGGPQGLATNLADMVVRGEISENDLLPGSTTKTVGSLIQEMAMAADPALALEADRRIAAQTAERNNARFTPATKAVQDAKAAREAARFKMDYEAVSNLGRIQNIQSLGIASKKFNRGSNASLFTVIPNADGEVNDRDGGVGQMMDYVSEYDLDGTDSSITTGIAQPGTDIGERINPVMTGQNTAIQMVGPDGQTVGYVDGKGQWIADVDLSVNAAPLTKTQQWLEANLPDQGKPGGASFGYPQVNIGDELALLNQRLGPNAPQGGIRSLEDLENTFVRMIDSKLDGGSALFRYDPETNKSVAVSDPGIGEVLYRLGYTQNETTRLANSFQQLEAARRSPVNQEFKMLYENGMYDPRGQFAANNYGNDIALQRVKNEKVEGKTVRGQLKALDGKSEVTKDRDPSSLVGVTPYDTVDYDDFGNVTERFSKGDSALLPEFQQDLVDAQEALGDAQKPFIGAPAGSPAPKASFIRGDARGQSRSELIKRMPAERADQALGVERRFLEDERRRRSPEPADPQREAVKARDAAIGAEGAKRKQRDIENKARGVKPVRATPQPYDANKIKAAVEKTDGSKPKFQREMEARIVAQAQAQGGLGAQLDLRAAGVANPQRATSAVTSPAPDPTPLQARGGWTSSNADEPMQAAKSVVSEERVRRDTEKPERRSSKATPGANTARNKLIKNILGYGGLGAGSVAAGMGIRSAYDASQQERDQEVYQ
tara:strand:- start:6324 stop:9137 length:2814 start_codon:yes stop_codon:yes gene_type:complete